MLIDQIQKEITVDLIDITEQIDILKTFFRLNEMDEIELSLYRSSIVKLIHFLETEEVMMLEEQLSIDKVEIDSFIKKLNVFRVACSDKTLDKAKITYTQLLDMGIRGFLTEILTLLKASIKEPYEKWLDENTDLINELAMENEKDGYQHETINKLANKMIEFFGPKLYVKLIKNRYNQFEFTPVYFTENGYIELKHPVTKRFWSVSGNASNHKEQLKSLQIGDIIQVNYCTVYKSATQFYKSLITLEYDNFNVLGKDLDSVLTEKFTRNEIQVIHQNLRVFSNDTQVLLKELVKVVAPSSKEFEDEIERVRSVNDQLNKDILKLNEEQKELTANKESIKQTLTEEEKKWTEILERIEYKIGDNNGEKGDTIQYNRESFISDLQSRIYEQSDNELIYDKTLLQFVLNAICADILTILTGPSGTGKSSLIEAIGQAISNVKVTMIPVQSSWTDAQDLLGYFHPNEKVFVATPFMEALATARIAELANKDELHIICLDEMNLAHIEYYFAQFLSVREQKNSKIILYPSRYEKWAFAVDTGEIEADFYMKQNARELIEKYPANFTLPSNVRFVGTLNMDHTVKALSPKVIDRSLIIELMKLDENEKEKVSEEIKKHPNPYAIEVPFTKFIEETFELDNEALKKVMEISALFNGFRDIPLNSRGEKHLRSILSYWYKPSNEIVDLLIKGKVLPRIEVKKSAIEHITIVQGLNDYKLSQQKIITMLNTNHTVSFW